MPTALATDRPAAVTPEWLTPCVYIGEWRSAGDGAGIGRTPCTVRPLRSRLDTCSVPVHRCDSLAPACLGGWIWQGSREVNASDLTLGGELRAPTRVATRRVHEAVGRSASHPSVLALARRRAGLTQHEAARRLELSPRTLQRYERDPDIVPLGILKRMAALYGMTLADLVARIQTAGSGGTDVLSVSSVETAATSVDEDDGGPRCEDEQPNKPVVRGGSTAPGRNGGVAGHASSTGTDQTPPGQEGLLGRRDSGFWRSLEDHVRGSVRSRVRNDDVDGVVQDSMLQLIEACSTCTTRACETACPLPELAATVACRRSTDRCRKLETGLKRVECIDLDTMPGADDQEQNGSARVQALVPTLGVPLEDLMLLWNRQVDEEGSRPS